jgi:hypothetical protein
MRITVDDIVLQKVPDFCMGVVAVKACDNEGPNERAETFLSRTCAASEILLHIQPGASRNMRASYGKLLTDLGEPEGLSTPADEVIYEFMKNAVEEESETAAEEPEAANVQPEDFLKQIRSVTVSEMKGSNHLKRVNPLMDFTRSVMLKHYIPVMAVDMQKKKGTLDLRPCTAEDEFYDAEGNQCPLSKNEMVLASGSQVIYRHAFAERSGEQAITEDTLFAMFLVPGRAENRAQVIAARNELARRMREAFDCPVEAGWIEGADRAWDSEEKKEDKE